MSKGLWVTVKDFNTAGLRGEEVLARDMESEGRARRGWHQGPQTRL